MTTMTDRPCHHQRSPFLPLRPLLLSVALLSFLFCHQLLPADANDGNDCSCPPSNYQDTKKETTGRPTSATTTKSPPTRIAYLITVHNQRTIDDALPLFKAIRSPQNIILIHVDRKCDWAVYVGSELREEVERCPCGASVLVDSVHSAEWSSWSMNDPTFWGMGQLVSNPTFQNRWDVFVNLSGDTLPVFTADALSRRFTEPAFKGINFVTSSSCETGYWPTSVYTFPEWWHKRAHYTNDPEGNPVLDYTDDDGHPQTSTLVIHFGSQWMVLQPDFVRYLVRSLQRRDSLPSRFKDYLIETGRLMTDETFIPTLLMHVHPFNTTLPRVNENGTLVDAPEMETIRYVQDQKIVPYMATTMTISNGHPTKWQLLWAWYSCDECESLTQRTNAFAPFVSLRLFLFLSIFRFVSFRFFNLTDTKGWTSMSQRPLGISPSTKDMKFLSHPLPTNRSHGVPIFSESMISTISELAAHCMPGRSVPTSIQTSWISFLSPAFKNYRPSAGQTRSALVPNRIGPRSTPMCFERTKTSETAKVKMNGMTKATRRTWRTTEMNKRTLTIKTFDVAKKRGFVGRYGRSVNVCRCYPSNSYSSSSSSSSLPDGTPSLSSREKEASVGSSSISSSSPSNSFSSPESTSSLSSRTS